MAMKTLIVVLFTFLTVGCATSSNTVTDDGCVTASCYKYHDQLMPQSMMQSYGRTRSTFSSDDR